jgi:NAD(P)-dependent dehydrogenase (short-subunit alcohol dehydrogenase family)
MSRAALIIGNSDGIGLALTRELLQRGWTVCGLSRRPAPIEHPAYRHSVVDVCAPSYGETLRAALPSELSLCFYCAGIGEFFDAARCERDVATLETNLVGLARTIEVVLPALLARPRATLVGLSSLADVMPSAQAPAYAASKVGMSYYLEGTGRALRRSSVRVVNVRLGFVDTKMAKASSRPFMLSPARAAERILARVLSDSPPLRLDLPRRMAWLMRWVAALAALAAPFRR